MRFANKTDCKLKDGYYGRISRQLPGAPLFLMLRSEIPSGMCAKLRIVAASNNGDQPTRTLYYCLFAPHSYIFFFAHIPFVVNHTTNATPPERLQHRDTMPPSSEICTIV